jgi:predicted  nucleic acid-binding Zn-ribbon protein
MSDRDVSDPPTTRILETDVESGASGQLESDISLLTVELEKITHERDDLKKELKASLVRISELEGQQKLFLDRLDKIEALILKELSDVEK